MTVELTIVGIRHYCGGVEGYPVLFSRLPVGSVVFLRLEPEGAQFPGSITVWDDENHQIGAISVDDIHFINQEIPSGAMLPATISGHSAEDNCMYAVAENTKGVTKRDTLEVPLERGETVFATTEHDQRLMQLTSLMKTKLQMLIDGKVGNTESLLRTAREYSRYCCTSLDGDTTFSRADILQELRFLKGTYPELTGVYSEIFNQKKDIGSKRHTLQLHAYQEQYKDIKDSALKSIAGAPSQLDCYIEKLKFANGDNLTPEILTAEIQRLSTLLVSALDGRFVEKMGDDEVFAQALYYTHYSLRATYILYTRRIKLEYLKELVGKVKPAPAPVVGAKDDDDVAECEEEHQPSRRDYCSFIHPKCKGEEAQEIDRQIKNLVGGSRKFKDICAYLQKLAEANRIILPPDPRTAIDELHRMGLPQESVEGYGYKNFCKYYTPMRNEVEKKKWQ